MVLGNFQLIWIMIGQGLTGFFGDGGGESG